MCGITGIFDLGTQPDSSLGDEALQAITADMTGRLQHRGPDSSGLWSDPDHALVLGHRRLAIVDLSAHGHQPMVSRKQRYVIAYNGEIYNFPEIKRILEDVGHSFVGHSDTEVILAAIEHWGINTALQKINGMFALALWDRKNAELHLLRDRFGKKPLYVGWAGDQIIFASELKAFAAHPAFQAEKQIDKDVLALYMRHSYVPAPYSIFKNVWSLPAGHRVTLKRGRTDIGADLSKSFEVYFNAGGALADQREKINTQQSDEDAVNALDCEMQAAIKRRLISDVPLGAFLSGGIDSSLVVALMQQQMNAPVKTFSIGFNEKKYNEAQHAKAIAEYLGTEHHEYYVDAADALKSLQAMADIYDEPFADASQIPTFMVAERARKEVTVVLTGDGGDEMFGGYKRHFEAPAIWRKMRFMPTFLRRPLAKLLLKFLPQSLQSRNSRVNRLLEVMPARSLRGFYDRLSQQWHDGDSLVKGSKDLPLLSKDIHFHADGLKDEESMVYWDVLSHLPDRMMVKVDRATMANSIESRSAFMDLELFKFAWSLPLSQKIRSIKGTYQGKFIVRELLARYLPRDLFERPKQGFSPPINEWLCGDLKSWAHEILFDTQAPANNYFEISVIEKAWQRTQQGSEADTLRIWNVLMFHLWYRRWM